MKRAAPSSPRAKQVTPAQRLAKLMVTKADLPGRDVSEADAQYAFAKSPDEVTVDKPGCAPLAYAMNQLPLGEPQADVTHTTGEGYGKGTTYITLASYEPAAGAVAFRSTMTFQGVTHTLHTEAVRSGDVLAVYFSVNGGAIADGRPSDAKLPAEVVKAQNAKLTE